jgi:hypothetical protein
MGLAEKKGSHGPVKPLGTRVDWRQGYYRVAGTEYLLRRQGTPAFTGYVSLAIGMGHLVWRYASNHRRGVPPDAAAFYVLMVGASRTVSLRASKPPVADARSISPGC